MTAPSCPACSGELVPVGLVATRIRVYTCPTCHAWFDSSLRGLDPSSGEAVDWPNIDWSKIKPVRGREKCLRCGTGRVRHLVGGEGLCERCYQRYRIKLVVVDEPDGKKKAKIE
jgi:hypothetical protein